jgi:hypothetical protein
LSYRPTLSIPSYQITETLHIGAKTLVYRDYREQTTVDAMALRLLAKPIS